MIGANSSYVTHSCRLGLADQQALVASLQGMTGMNPAFSLQCLESNNWNPTAAFANFQELQASGQLPASAFS